jgi:hypothetical protein
MIRKLAGISVAAGEVSSSSRAYNAKNEVKRQKSQMAKAELAGLRQLTMITDDIS